MHGGICFRRISSSLFFSTKKKSSKVVISDIYIYIEISLLLYFIRRCAFNALNFFLKSRILMVCHRGDLYFATYAIMISQ